MGTDVIGGLPLAQAQAQASAIAQALVSKGIPVTVTVIIAFILYQLTAISLSKVLAHKVKEDPEATPAAIGRRKRLQTSILLLKQVVKYAFLLVTGYIVVAKIVGAATLAPLLAGAGIMGLAVGFGAQSLVRDVVSGFFILFEGQFSVGDMVHLRAAGYEAFGIVEEFGLRTTIIRDLNGNQHYLQNGTIAGVDRYTRGYLRFDIDITLPGDTPAEDVRLAVEALADYSQTHPYLLEPPKLNSLVEVSQALMIAVVETKVVPFQDWLVEHTAKLLAEELKSRLGLEEPPPTTSYLVCEEALERYKVSVLV